MHLWEKSELLRLHDTPTALAHHSQDLNKNTSSTEISLAHSPCLFGFKESVLKRKQVQNPQVSHSEPGPKAELEYRHLTFVLCSPPPLWFLTPEVGAAHASPGSYIHCVPQKTKLAQKQTSKMQRME